MQNAGAAEITLITCRRESAADADILLRN